jgi:DNA-binding response OmpR family regulator
MGKKVLIVEDEPELLAMMADAFRRADLEVYTAGNGEVALELFHTVHPDLVITDIVMPAKEGVALIMDIKRSAYDAPVIAISGGGTRACKDYLRWAKELGAALVLQKPFRMSILLMMARFLMEKAAVTAARQAQERPVSGRPLQSRLMSPPDLAELFDDLFEESRGLGSSLNPV